MSIFSAREAYTCHNVPEGGRLSMDKWDTGGSWCRTLGARPDELACVRVIDPNLRSRMGFGMDGCGVEQGCWKHIVSVWKGCRAVIPGGGEQGT